MIAFLMSPTMAHIGFSIALAFLGGVTIFQGGRIKHLEKEMREDEKEE